MSIPRGLVIKLMQQMLTGPLTESRWGDVYVLGHTVKGVLFYS